MDEDAKKEASDGSPILIVPYMWIGDFVRCHSVIRLLLDRFPNRPIDVLTTRVVAPLLDYMPGVRKGIVFDLPRKRIAFSAHRALAKLLRAEHYGDVLIMPRTWKSALAPYLAGIARRTGFVGEMRFGLINDLRFGERALPRMVDRCATLALPTGAGGAARRDRGQTMMPPPTPWSRPTPCPPCGIRWGSCRTAARPPCWRPAPSARRSDGRLRPMGSSPVA
jgi:heptosyltransferase II